MAGNRERLAVREIMARTHPEMAMHLYVDAMDNKKNNVPMLGYYTFAKSAEQAGEPLRTQLTGTK